MVRADAPSGVLAELCRCVCYPRLLLRAAELRAALVALGDEPGVGAQVRARAARCCLQLHCDCMLRLDCAHRHRRKDVMLLRRVVLHMLESQGILGVILSAKILVNMRRDTWPMHAVCFSCQEYMSQNVSCKS